MAKYRVEMKVVNSGSPNGLPCRGAASECYLSIGSVSSNNPSETNVTTLAVRDICNGHTYSSFLDAKSKTDTNIIDIDDSTSSALVLTFSTYWGSEWFEDLLKEVIKKAVGVAFGNIYAGIATNMAGDLLKEILKVFEKELASQIKTERHLGFNTVGVETVDDFGSSLSGDPVTLKIRSDIDLSEIFVDFPVIRVGELVAEVTLTKVS